MKVEALRAEEMIELSFLENLSLPGSNSRQPEAGSQVSTFHLTDCMSLLLIMMWHREGIRCAVPVGELDCGEQQAYANPPPPNSQYAGLVQTESTQRACLHHPNPESRRLSGL